MQFRKLAEILKQNSILRKKDGVYTFELSLVTKKLLYECYGEGAIKFYKFRKHKGVEYVDILPKKVLMECLRNNIISQIVYVVYDATGLCKIGKTTNIENRIKTLRISNTSLFILRAYKGEDSLEKSLHSKFKDKRKGGEWFILNKEDVLWMDKNLDRIPTQYLPKDLIWKPY